MCEGSSPHLSKETQSLLRSRLRISALLLGAGFSVFFVRQLFFVPQDAGTQYWALHDVFWLMSLGCSCLGAACAIGTPSSFRLCARRSWPSSDCRRLFFIFLQLRVLTAREPILTGITSPWILLILVYSLYIPNTWKRAAWVLGFFAAAPVVLLVTCDVYDVEIARSGYSV